MRSITGICGLAAYTVSLRVREVGIRVTIGALPAQVLRLIFARTSVLAAAGEAAGLAPGMAGAHVLAGIVYQASSRDRRCSSGGRLRASPARTTPRSGAGAPAQVAHAHQRRWNHFSRANNP